MRRELNPELDRLILEALSEKYRLAEQREGTHLSSLIYCLTKAYFDAKSPLLPTDTEVLLFATGYGLQEILTPTSTTSPVFKVDGITYSPDAILPYQMYSTGPLVEIKSTRAGVKKYQEGDFPETWVNYMKGGCYIRNENTYNLIVIYLAERPSAKIISETITFTDEEITRNWVWLLERKTILDEAMMTEKVPTPFKYCATWMCEHCRYKTICEVVSLHNKSEEGNA